VATCYDINTYKDFEIIWIDKNTHQPKDMDSVTFELYHYQEAQPGIITVPVKEPYIITEGITDMLDVASIENNLGIAIDVDVIVDLNIIATQLAGLGCPPNDFVVCGTGNKVSIVNGYKKAALSACELAALINIGSEGVGATGYHAYSQDGFLVLRGDYTGSAAYIEIGSGNMNSVLGVIYGLTSYGSDTRLIFDITPQPMTRISTGRYVYPNVALFEPYYTLEERYFVLFRGTDPVTLIPEIYEEDFALIEARSDDFNYSFIK